MRYHSTRGESLTTSKQTILQGMASDGGLFVPENIPHVDADFIQGLVGKPYETVAAEILRLYLTDYTDAELKQCAQEAYASGTFDNVHRAPLRTVGDMQILELWHGPTSAFKDMALQILPRLLSLALATEKNAKDVLILVATSGDTGKAALAGFQDVPHIKILVFYPAGGVAAMQKLQMVTQAGQNVAVCAVRGNFDDAQAGVKAIFHDAVFQKTLPNVSLSSANSINWGRLVPQIVYYFTAYTTLLAEERMQMGTEVNFTVPTGNFGDILAGYYAKQMGLPVGKLICAANRNDVLKDFLQTGIYDRRRAFYKTLSPSMDILVSSNLERLLWHVTQDVKQVRTWMEDLKQAGHFQVDAQTLQAIQKDFATGSADDVATSAQIAEVYRQYAYVIDPHTAVAWKVAANYRMQTKDNRPMVILSTASPYKFCASVLQALGEKADGEPFELLDALAQKNPTPVPRGLANLRTATERFTEVVAKEDMRTVVRDFASK